MAPRDKPQPRSKALKPRSRNLGSTPTPTTPVERQGRVEYLRGQLAEAHRDLDAARKAESWQAVAALRRQTLYISEEIARLEEADRAAPGGRDVSGLTEEEFLGALAESAAGMPDAYLEVYVRAYMDRHGIAVLGAAG